MKKWGVIALGVVFNIVGIVWIFQGINVLPGSFMSGDITWTVIGFIIAAIGDVLIFLSVTKRSNS